MQIQRENMFPRNNDLLKKLAFLHIMTPCNIPTFWFFQRPIRLCNSMFSHKSFDSSHVTHVASLSKNNIFKSMVTWKHNFHQSGLIYETRNKYNLVGDPLLLGWQQDRCLINVDPKVLAIWCCRGSEPMHWLLGLNPNYNFITVYPLGTWAGAKFNISTKWLEAQGPWGTR